MTNPKTVTLTFDAADVDWILAAMCDSATYWHHLWQDAEEGRRPDLNPASCRGINRRAWRLHDAILAQISA